MQIIPYSVSGKALIRVQTAWFRAILPKGGGEMMSDAAELKKDCLCAHRVKYTLEVSSRPRRVQAAQYLEELKASEDMGEVQS